jgi:hypothetical protein
MSHAMVNVDVTENAPTVKPSPFSASVGVWIDGDTSLHFRDAGHLGEWLAAACEGLRDLLDAPQSSEPIETRDPEAIRAHMAKGGTVEWFMASTGEWAPCDADHASPSHADHRLLPLPAPLKCVGSELPEAQEPVG